MSERLLRTRDVAELLDVSCETVLRWYRSGKLPGGRRLGSNVLRFSEPELEAWIDGTRSERALVSVRSGGVRSVTCLGLGTDTKLRSHCKDARGLRAGALIAVLGGLRAEGQGGRP